MRIGITSYYDLISIIFLERNHDKKIYSQNYNIMGSNSKINRYLDDVEYFKSNS